MNGQQRWQGLVEGIRSLWDIANKELDRQDGDDATPKELPRARCAFTQPAGWRCTKEPHGPRETCTLERAP